MIRRAAAEDVETLVAVFEPSFATLDFLPALHTHEENVAFFARCMRDGEAWLHGADGFALVIGDTLTHLYVRPDAIGKGIGHALFEHVTERRPDGFDFWVFQQNERARRFYERHGAEPVEFGDGSGNEEGAPDVRYEWRPQPARGSSVR
ncbi:MAG TPA: GNAT family N-acetyltransferase [Gaiellaceae bacterium]|jgi:GNAT superfamily N-acetyltransferase|nr:GNAT family N-acetyltransferase [Gaiellaceae bacterium]